MSGQFKGAERARETLAEDKGANVHRPRGRLQWNKEKENAGDRKEQPMQPKHAGGRPPRVQREGSLERTTFSSAEKAEQESSSGSRVD